MTSSFIYIILLLATASAQDCNLPFQPIGGGCYFYDETLYIDSFPATVDFCASLGGYPVVVRNGEENRQLINYIYPDRLLGDVVILGATRNDLGLFEWVDGTLVRDEFDHWYPGEPNGSGDCMAWAAHYAMYWDDITCEDFNGTFVHVAFVCEDDVLPSSTTDGTRTPTPSTTPTETTTETTTVAAACPAPFVELETGCYYASKEERESWSGSKLACEYLTGYLAVITSDVETQAINSYLNDVYPEPTDDVWIGLYDEADNDVYVWIDGSQLTYTNWADNEPDGANQNHVFLSDSEMWKWGDELNSVAQFFLCEAEYSGVPTTPGTTTPAPGDCMPPFELVDTGCYYASEEQRQSWTGARLACEGLGGHLAVITSSQEQSALVGYLNRVYPEPTDDVWIGGLDELKNDQWVWVDGSTISYSSWAENEPDAGTQDYMFMSDAQGWNWGNEINSIEQFYLCEQA